MKRALASLLLVLFSFPLISPALFANSAPTLPSCCRRDGKHHCAMTETAASQTPSGGAVVKSTPSKCPLFPCGGSALPDNYKPIRLAESVRYIAPEVVHSDLSPRTHKTPHASPRGEVNKRGPPIDSQLAS